MISTLDVRFGNALVGHLRVHDDRFGFRYAESWLTTRDRFPVSHSMPFRPDELVGGAAHTFFSNLLPEGGMRTAVCARLGISEGNDIALLAAIGGECAGALSIVEPGARAVDPDDFRYEELSPARLQQLVERDDLVPLLVGGATTRLSLAGAQDKVPVAVLDGVLHLPTGVAPSTHILKLPHARFDDIAVGEAFVLGLATQIGMTAVSVELLDTMPPSLLVERYDRVASAESWPVIRLHQEDFCQALGLAPTRKYEQEGGPSFAAAIRLVGEVSSRAAADIARVLEWQAFNLVVGNSDGHGKNLAFLYEGTRRTLAPFYDLLSTRQYAALDRNLAMGIGAVRDPGQVRRAQWEALAKAATLGVRVVVDRVRGIAERTLESLPAWTAEFTGRYGKHALVQRMRPWIEKSARRVVRSL